MKKAIAILGTWALAVGGMFAITSTHPSKAATPTPPFHQCPDIGLSTGCSVLFVVNPDQSVTVLRDAAQRPYEGSDDITVGVLNNSSGPIGDVKITQNGGATPIFGFEGDGICEPSGWPQGRPPAGAAAPAGCPFGPTGYEGPNTSFSNINAGATSGQVDFPAGLNAGASTYFGLEGSPQDFAGSPGSPGSPGRTDYNGYSTGTNVFADLAKNLSPGQEALNADVAFSGAASNGTGLKPINNEMSIGVVPSDLETVKPTKPAIGPFNTYGRGSGLEAGLGKNVPVNPDINDIILSGLAEQAAAPQTPASDGAGSKNPVPDSVLKDSIAVPGDPLIYASVLRGWARADNNALNCNTVATNNAQGTSDITKDLGFGLGWAAKAQLVDQGSANPDGSMQKPTVSVETPIGTQPPGITQDIAGQSKSFNFLTPNGNGSFALTSETIQSVAPVSLNLGGSVLTIEVGGPWLLTSTANGSTPVPPHLGPLDQKSPTTLLITFTPPGMPTQTILKTQDLFSASMIPTLIQIPPGPAPHLAEIAIGESPRKIGGTQADAPVSTATETSAADDVVRVTLLEPATGAHLAEVRVGHIESKAVVPVGGIECPTPPTPPTPPLTFTVTADAFTGPPPTTTTSPPNTNPPVTFGPATTSTTAAQRAATTTTTAAPQVLATTFAQTPTAQAQRTQPNFTG